MGRSRERGFTLVELLVAVAIITIIATIALPSFKATINSSKLTTAANTLNAALQQARVESMRRNTRVTVCSSSNADAGTPACSGSLTWSGWIMFLDPTHTGQPAASTSVLARGTFKTPLTVIAKSDVSSGTIFFRPDGFARAQGGTTFLTSVIRVCIPTRSPAQNIRDIAIYSGSRFYINTSSGGGACAAPTVVP